MEPAIRFHLMPPEKNTTRSYRFSKVTAERQERLAELLQLSDTAILENAIAHLLGTIERNQPVWLTSPTDLNKRHKTPRDAA